MYCVIHGRVKVVVFDESKNKYRFFNPNRWERMTIKQQSKYRIDW